MQTHKKTISFFLMLIVCAACFAQKRNSDSLREVLKAKTDTSQFDDYVEICWAFLNQAQFDSAEVWAEKFYEAGEKLSSDKFRAEALYMKGISLARRGGYDPEAVEAQTKAIELYQKEENYSGQGFAYLMIGFVYYNQVDYPTAKTFWLKSRDMFNKANDERGLANVYTNLGAIEEMDSNYVAAENLYRQALSIFEGRRSNGGIATCLSALANIKMVQYAQSKDSLERKQLSLAAYEYLMEGLKRRRESGNFDGVVNQWHSIGTYYLNIGNADLAIIYGDSTLQAGLAHDAKDDTRDAYALLSEAYALKGDYENAYKHLQLGESMDDSLRGAEVANKTASVIAEYEAAQVQKQVEYDKKISRFITISVAGGLLLTLALCVVAYRAYRKSKKFSAQLASQNEIISQKNADITDSIQYSRRIQEALLPDAKQVKKILGDAFVFYKPKDIISGDFYWLQEKQDKVFFMAADCTGHGVPGALMSMIGTTLLDESIGEKQLDQPGAILDDVRTGIIRSLKQQDESGEEGKTKDGMDGALCMFDRTARQLYFAGAYNPLWVVRNGEVLEYKGDKFPVGISGTELRSFTTHKVETKSGDMIYVFTDGYVDQFGGDKGKKLKYSGLKELLIECSGLPAGEQNAVLEKHFSAWKGDLEQVDDVCVIGVRID
jgi:serine phosphatase RsbU (regulator of sigma subunit)